MWRCAGLWRARAVPAHIGAREKPRALRGTLGASQGDSVVCVWLGVGLVVVKFSYDPRADIGVVVEVGQVRAERIQDRGGESSGV